MKKLLGKYLVIGSILAICSMISFGSTANAMNAQQIVGALKHSVKRTLQQASFTRTKSFIKGTEFVENGYTLVIQKTPEESIARFHENLTQTMLQAAETSRYLVKCDPVALNEAVKLSEKNANTNSGDMEEDATNKAVQALVKSISDDRNR